MKQFKVLLVGDAGVGKTAFIKRWLTDKYTEYYSPTIGAEVYPILLDVEYKSVKEKVCLNLWDVAGDKNQNGLRDGYYVGADIAVIMLDKANDINKVGSYFLDIKRVCPNIPIVLVENKLDLSSNRYNLSSDILGYKYVNISVKEDYGLDFVFGVVLEQLYKDPSVMLMPKSKKYIRKNEIYTQINTLVEELKTLDLQ